MFNYYVWMGAPLAKYARVLRQPEFMLKWKEDYLLNHGVPVSHLIPDERVFQINPKSGKVIPDCLPNTAGVLLVAETLKEYLQEHSGADVEFVRSKVKNHRGRLQREPFYIANILGAVDCIDKKKSDIEWFDSDNASCIKRLVPDYKRIPKDAKLFRLAKAMGVFLVRDDFCGELVKNAPCRGSMFAPVAEYGYEWRTSEETA